jgi:effector-binding domain-containing protein
MKTTTYPIKEITWPERIFLTKKANVSFNNLPAFFGQAYGEIYGALQKLGIQSNEPPCAFYYKIDEINNETEVAAAVPVPQQLPAINHMDTVLIPSSKVLTTTYHGSYENMTPAYKELEEYISANHLAKSLIVEEYLSNPQVEKDPAKWKTNIYFVLKG